MPRERRRGCWRPRADVSAPTDRTTDNGAVCARTALQVLFTRRDFPDKFWLRVTSVLSGAL